MCSVTSRKGYRGRLTSLWSIAAGEILNVVILLHIDIQWNPDLTKCHGTGEIGSLNRGSLNREPRYNEFVEN